MNLEDRAFAVWSKAWLMRLFLRDQTTDIHRALDLLDELIVFAENETVPSLRKIAADAVKEFEVA